MQIKYKKYFDNSYMEHAMLYVTPLYFIDLETIKENQRKTSDGKKKFCLTIPVR